MTHKVTDITIAKVKALGAFLPDKYIMQALDIKCNKTLKKHYGHILADIRADKDMKVVNSLFLNAIEGNVTAQIFWCKTRLGMTEQVANASEENKDDDTQITKIEVEIAKPEKNKKKA